MNASVEAKVLRNERLVFGEDAEYVKLIETWNRLRAERSIEQPNEEVFRLSRDRVHRGPAHSLFSANVLRSQGVAGNDLRDSGGSGYRSRYQLRLGSGSDAYRASNARDSALRRRNLPPGAHVMSDPDRALVARSDPPWGNGRQTGRVLIPLKNGLEIPGGCYAATGEGTEMEPEIFDGDVLIIDPNSRPVVGDLVIIYFNVRHQPLVKRIVV